MLGSVLGVSVQGTMYIFMALIEKLFLHLKKKCGHEYPPYPQPHMLGCSWIWTYMCATTVSICMYSLFCVHRIFCV